MMVRAAMAAHPRLPRRAAHANRAPHRVASRPQGVRRAGRADDDRSDDSVGRRRSRREDQSGAAGACRGRRGGIHGVPLAAGTGAVARVIAGIRDQGLGIGLRRVVAQRSAAYYLFAIAQAFAQERIRRLQVRQSPSRRSGWPWPSRRRASRRELGVRGEGQDQEGRLQGHSVLRAVARPRSFAAARIRRVVGRASGRNISTASRSSRIIPI